MDIEKKKVFTHKFRVSFPSVFEPKSFEGAPPKYSVVMLFPKKTDLSKRPEGAKSGVSMKEAVFNCLTEQFGEKSKWPKDLRLPFRDGDQKETEGYAGHIYVTATSKKKPGVINGRLEHITSEEEFYAGCYARATLLAFYYDRAGNKGVSFSLQNIQKLEDGENLGGRKRAEDEFEATEDASEVSSGDDNAFDLD